MTFPQKQVAITAWSFSRWLAYDQCPLKLKLTAIDKLPEPKGAALVRGADIHDQARDYLMGATAKLPAELAKFSDHFEKTRALRKKRPADVVVEDTWAFRRDWTPTTYDDWNGCWVRIKLDLAVLADDVLEVTDYKTGKYRPDDVDNYLLQLSLYGLGGLLTFLPRAPEVKVRPRLLYLDTGDVHDRDQTGKRIEYAATDLAPLKKWWEARVAPLLADRKFAPKPNRWCGYCHFRKSNGGPCQY